MQQHTEQDNAGMDEFRLTTGLVLKPPVTAEDLQADTENDPEGAEEFVALLRALRHERSRRLAL